MARILIVDDDASIRELIQLMCENDGHEVRTASDEADAVEAYVAFLPEVMVLDLRMRGGGCREVVARLRARLGHEPCPWIAVTGAAHGLLDHERSAVAPAAVVLPKPFDMQVLLRTVREVVQAGSPKPRSGD